MNEQDYQRYKSDGGAWINKEKKLNKHPDLRGHVVVTMEQINRLIQMARSGQEPRMQLGVWKRTAKQTDEFFLYIATDVYMREQQQAQQAPMQQGFRGAPQPPSDFFAPPQPQRPQTAYQPPTIPQYPEQHDPFALDPNAGPDDPIPF